MNNDEITSLLVKYITLEANALEIAQIKDWINAHPENEQYFAQLYETWHNMLYLQPAEIDNKVPGMLTSISKPSKPLCLKKFELPDLLVYCSTALMLTGGIYIVLNITDLGVF